MWQEKKSVYAQDICIFSSIFICDWLYLLVYRYRAYISTAKVYYVNYMYALERQRDFAFQDNEYRQLALPPSKFHQLKFDLVFEVEFV